jgi:thiol-disulfide isomerase/thioredoxin
MKSNKNYILILLAVVVGAAALYFSLRGTSDETATESPAAGSASAISSNSPYLTLSDLKGNTVAMDTSKLVFVNVWATWCGPCNAEMPSIESLYERYKDNPKMAFYVVSDEDASTVLPFLERKDYDLPFYLYSGTYPDALNGNAIPRTYMVRNGKVLVEQVGAMNWNDPQVISFIDEQLAM